MGGGGRHGRLAHRECLLTISSDQAQNRLDAQHALHGHGIFRGEGGGGGQTSVRESFGFLLPFLRPERGRDMAFAAMLREGNLITTHCIHRYKDLFTKGGTSRDYSAGVPFFIRHRRQNLIETIVEYKGLELTKTLAFQVEALPYLEMSMSNNFGNEKYELSVQEYAELLTSCVPRELFETLNAPVTPSSISDDMLSMLL